LNHRSSFSLWTFHRRHYFKIQLKKTSFLKQASILYLQNMMDGLLKSVSDILRSCAEAHGINYISGWVGISWSIAPFQMSATA